MFFYLGEALECDSLTRYENKLDGDRDASSFLLSKLHVRCSVPFLVSTK